MYFIFQRQFHFMLIDKILINFTMNHLFINTLLINSVNFSLSNKSNGLAFVNLMLIEYYPSLLLSFPCISTYFN